MIPNSGDDRASLLLSDLRFEREQPLTLFPFLSSASSCPLPHHETSHAVTVPVGRCSAYVIGVSSSIRKIVIIEVPTTALTSPMAPS